MCHMASYGVINQKRRMGFQAGTIQGPSLPRRARRSQRRRWDLWLLDVRRKFRSQTSDNMDRWKAEMGRASEKRRVCRREKMREEKVRRKKMQMCEKVGKSRNTVLFPWFVAPDGPKVGSLKRRVWSHLARWEMKNCMLLWREAHFQVKMNKAHHSRSIFGSCDVEKVHALVARSTFRIEHVLRSCDVEKVHAVVARSTFRSENVQNTPAWGRFWKLRSRKSARCCSAKHVRSQNVKNTRVPDHFWTLRCRFAWQAHGIVHLLKSE